MTRPSKETCKTVVTALLKALGYYIAYRVMRWAFSKWLLSAAYAMSAAGWTDGVSVATLNKLLNITLQGAIAVVIVLWFALRRRPLRGSLGLTALRGACIPWCLLCGAGATVTVGWLYNVIPFPSDWMATYTDKAGALFAEYSVWTFVMTALVAPLMEEVVFRGLLFKRLREGIPFWAAALLSATAFGAAHASVLWMLYAFVLGWLLAWLFERTGSLWASVLCHFGFNLIGQLSLGGMPLWLYAAFCALGTLLMLFSLWQLRQKTDSASKGDGLI